MNNKDIFYFIATCLTISLDYNNKIFIEKKLKTVNIDWNAVVKISTAHYVLPAFYSNLRRQGFLHYLPKDLVEYMSNIANLNRERNQQIFRQAEELNTLLLANNITPIFLKGTANLLAGLYDDVADRMIGDIDFIFSKKDYLKTIKVLRDNGYCDLLNYNINSDQSVEAEIPIWREQRHYRRLQKKNNIAAVEIHKELILEKYTSEFNYKLIQKDSQVINQINVLSFANKLNLSIISNQINDRRFYYKTIDLRNAYDVFLLSKRTSSKKAVNSLKKLSHPLNCFLAACFDIFNNVDSIKYNNTKKTEHYLLEFKNKFENTRKIKLYNKCITIYLYLIDRLNILIKSFIYKDYRLWVFRRITDRNWYKEKLIELMFK